MKIKRCPKCCRIFPELEIVVIDNTTMTVEKPVATEILKLRAKLSQIRAILNRPDP